MYFSVAEIISYLSRSFTLEAGDVIATGTPGGVGVFRDPPRFLGDGDRVTVEIERIGRLENTCRVERNGRPVVSEERFLVTGALGCVGAWTVRELVREGTPVVGFDLGTNTRRLAQILEPDELEHASRSSTATSRTCRDRARPRRARDHERRPPRGAPGSVLPGRPAAGRRGQRRRHRERLRGGSSAGPVRRPSSTRARWRRTRRATSIRRPAGSRRTPSRIPANHYGVYKVANEGNARIYWADSGVASVGRPADDGVRRRARPGHDERPDGRDRGGGARPAVRDRLRRVRRSSSTPRTSRRRCCSPADPSRSGRGCSTWAARRSRSPTGWPRSRTFVPDAAGTISVAAVELPFPAAIAHESLASSATSRSRRTAKGSPRRPRSTGASRRGPAGRKRTGRARGGHHGQLIKCRAVRP